MIRFEPDLERIRRGILKFAEFTSPREEGHTRISFSKEDKDARAHVSLLMEEARLAVSIDAAGNIIGRRQGKETKPAILSGSHLDTVRGGGRFDGISGMVAAIETARRFEELGVENVHPIEVVVFLAEELSPFGLSTIGSRSMAGKLSQEQITTLRDETGRFLAEAIAEMGGDPLNIGRARRSADDIMAYLELHIEQGPHLNALRTRIGAVTGIVGIWRASIEVIGRNDHAGTTPMALRRDALAAGSEAILALERVCKSFEGVVGTVGRVEVFPNALEVVPGRVTMGVEIRSLHEEVIDRVNAALRAELYHIMDKRGMTISFELWKSSEPVLFSASMVHRINTICDQLGVSCAELPSGAGHDANHLAEIAPVGMIFVPSRDGRSHCPEEWTEFEDVALGTEVLAQLICEIDKEGLQ
jgi:N-carbamoyl-L-amino-acid hydrolase